MKRSAVLFAEVGGREGLTSTHRRLARFDPVEFSPVIIGAVERTASVLGLPVRTMPSGTGHDAQSFAPNCLAGMIFAPSASGISYNVTEHTDIEAGTSVLLRLLVELAGDAR